MVEARWLIAVGVLCAACGTVENSSQDAAPPATDAAGDASLDGPPAIDAQDDAAPDGPPSVKRVFVSSLTYSANLGGVSGADQTCTTLASGLGGIWRAWISGPTPNEARQRFAHAEVPYTLVDRQTLVASDWTGLVSGSILHPIDTDENGKALESQSGCIDADCFYAFTATTASGAHERGFDCEGWTVAGDAPAITGNSTETGAAWSRNSVAFSSGCRLRARLYCFEQ
jgi:hypothetical protein